MAIIDVDRIRASFEKHRKEAHVTTSRYVRSRSIALGDAVLQRERVYLDLNYWLRLRDVVLGRRNNPELISLLASLRDSVKHKERICPISESTFLELLKQQDQQTRLATAELIDELSEGVSLAPLHERIATEAAHFMYANLGRDVLPIARLIWSRPSYTLGVAHPLSDIFDEGQQQEIQKAFFDYMWEMPLKSMMSTLDIDAAQKAEMDIIAENLNRLNSQNANSLKSFNQTYEDEFIGGLELAADTGQQVIEQMWIEAGNESATAEKEAQQHKHQVFSLLCAIFKQKREVITRALPTLQIGALCHAAIRWDQRRKLTSNDLFDFHHAQAALPYCDVFLTERPLHMLLQQRHIDIGKYFSCSVISSPVEAAAFLLKE